MDCRENVLEPFTATIQSSNNPSLHHSVRIRSARSSGRTASNGSGPRPGRRYRRSRILRSEKSGLHSASVRSGGGEIPCRFRARPARPAKSRHKPKINAEASCHCIVGGVVVLVDGIGIVCHSNTMVPSVTAVSAFFSRPGPAISMGSNRALFASPSAS